MLGLWRCHFFAEKKPGRQSKPGPVKSLEVLCRCWRPTGVKPSLGASGVLKRVDFLWLNIHAKEMRGDEFQVRRHKWNQIIEELYNIPILVYIMFHNIFSLLFPRSDSSHRMISDPTINWVNVGFWRLARTSHEPPPNASRIWQVLMYLRWMKLPTDWKHPKVSLVYFGVPWPFCFREIQVSEILWLLCFCQMRSQFQGTFRSSICKSTADDTPSSP